MTDPTAAYPEAEQTSGETPTSPVQPSRRVERENGNGNRHRNGSAVALRTPNLGRRSPDQERDARVASAPIREGDRALEAMGRDALHRRLLATADASAAGLALLAAILLGGDSPTLLVLVMLPLTVFVSKVIGLYDRDEHILHKTTLDETPKLLNLSIAGTLLAWMFDSVLNDEPFSKPQVAALFVFLFVSIAVARMLARRLALWVAPPERLLVLGSAAEAGRVIDNLERVSPLKAEVVGRIPVAGESRADRGDDVLGIMLDLDYVLSANRIDRVVICPHSESSTEMLDTIRLVKGLGVKVSVVPRLFEVVGSSVEFDDLGGVTLLGIRRYQLTKSSAALKRAFDVTGAALGLLLLTPLLLVVALAIKVTSRGPVFFRQPRIGRGGEAFAMLKFRTMYDGSDGLKTDLLHRNEGADGFFKIADDPRVTPLGRVLRRTAVDELPQLINVVRGEMSLVGPRPLVDEEDARIEGSFRRRLDITPGMTGAWQVLGSSRIPMRDMVTIDYLYRTNWSLWLDIKILLRTVPYVLRRQGM